MIAVDICNTLADVNAVLDETYGRREKGTYLHPSVTQETFQRNPGIFAKALPLKGAAEQLRKLEKIDELVYITARPKSAEAVTTWFLQRYHFPKAKIYFTKEKAELAKKLGVTLAIDDSPYEVANFKAAGIPVIVVAQDYNTEVENRFYWENFYAILQNIQRQVRTP